MYRLSILDAAMTSSDPILMLQYALANSKLRFNEGYLLYKTMYADSSNKFKTIESLLPFFAEPKEVQLFLSKVFSDDSDELESMNILK